MATETLSKQFYKHDAYVASYYAIYIALEKFLANRFLREDLSRVQLSSDDYAFRRRFELTDPSVAYDQVAASSLQFPFANYWPGNTAWKPDERVAAGSASLRFIGLSENTRMLRAIAVTTDIPVTFYFDRDDDARLAHETLLWHAFREQLLYTVVTWKGETLQIPMNIKIQDLSYSPDFKEKEWLEQNRLFVVKARIELRSFILQPPEQPVYTSNVSVEDNEKFMLTEEVVLQMLSAKKLMATLSIDTLFNQNPEITINQFGVVASTPTTARIAWDISTVSTIQSITLEMQGRENVEIAENTGFHVYRRLSENSTYIATIRITTVDGKSKVLATQFTTPLSEASTLAAKADPNTLVGVTW